MLCLFWQSVEQHISKYLETYFLPALFSDRERDRVTDGRRAWFVRHCRICSAHVGWLSSNCFSRTFTFFRISFWDHFESGKSDVFCCRNEEETTAEFNCLVFAAYSNQSKPNKVLKLQSEANGHSLSRMNDFIDCTSFTEDDTFEIQHLMFRAWPLGVRSINSFLGMQAQRQQQQQQQPQAVSQPQITKQQSLILLKNMVSNNSWIFTDVILLWKLRISVSTICYLRQMFPEECFRDIEYGNCKLSQLQCAEIDDNGVTVIKVTEWNVMWVMVIKRCWQDQNAFLLTQWLERGVFAALNHEYLHTMVFSVFTTHPQTGKDVLLENYEFKIGYPREEEQDDQQYLDDDTTTGKNNNNNRTKPMKSARKKLSEFNSTKKGISNNVMTVNNVPIHSKDDVKAQANKFIRELIQFTRTLDELPPNRWITISLTVSWVKLLQWFGFIFVVLCRCDSTLTRLLSNTSQSSSRLVMIHCATWCSVWMCR